MNKSQNTIDSLSSVALAVHSKPGLFALLLGSGISRPAGIPTGWEIVLDLIKKISILENEDCGDKPEDWYYSKYGNEPKYSELLEKISNSSAERQSILREYFEPSTTEHEAGFKLPTQAHKAIASLVGDGYIKVIITTNFDDLLETALYEVNIKPVVIDTPDALEGSFPLALSGCTVIKINGDYRDTRIKNTSEELVKYDVNITKLVENVFADYGLVICGWSGEWDIALGDLLKRTTNNKFSTYWFSINQLSEVSKKIAKQRNANIIEHLDANTVFTRLESKVSALRRVSANHPSTPERVISNIKDIILDESKKIILNDMVSSETEKICKELTIKNYPVENVEGSKDNFQNRAKKFESLTETLVHLFIQGCYWGNKNTDSIWSKSLERIANNIKNPLSGLYIWIKLRLYPSLILMYAGCLASLANDKYHTFGSLLFDTKLWEEENEYQLATNLNIWDVVERPSFWSPGNSGDMFATSQHLYELLRDPMREYLPDEANYKKYFERFEYYLALINLDINKDKHFPIGLYAYNMFISDRTTRMSRRIDRELIQKGKDWPLLKMGLFDGSVERVRELMKKVDEISIRSRWISI